MQPERNAPCPCGSGKKYKKCCYLDGHKTIAEIQLKTKDIKYNDKLFNEVFENEMEDIQENYFDDDYYFEDDDEFDEDDEDEELFASEHGKYLDLLTNLRKMLLKDKPHYKEYIKIRKMHGEIVNAMINYHQNGKFAHKIIKDKLPQEKSDKSLTLLNSNFDLSTKTGTQGFFDILIYKSISNMNCITEDFIKRDYYKRQDKKDFLNSMLNTKPGLFEVTDTNIHEGYAYLKNVFTGEENKIIDIGLSGNNNNDEYYIYMRVITHNGISFGTGLSLVFKKNNRFIKEHIKHHKNNFSAESEFTRFIELYNQYTSNPDRVQVSFNAYDK